MAILKNNALVITSLLVAAALVCLGVGLRLLAVSSKLVAPTEVIDNSHLLASMTIGGGVVVFLLATVALLVARRSTLAAGRRHDPQPQTLSLVAIQEWSRELAGIRDDMRRDLADTAVDTEIQHHLVEVPDAWQPTAQYLIADDGQSADPLADLRRTRGRLIKAARRVDIIVQSINETATTPDLPTTSTKGDKHWWRWWKFR